MTSESARVAFPEAQAVSEFLASLGDTADEVHAWLTAHDIPFGSHVSRDCPIALALRQQFPELPDSFDWGVGVHFATFGYIVVVLPDAVSDFVRRYDRQSGLTE